MKKLAFIFAICLTLCLTGCNYDMIDTVYTYNYAIIELPNGEIVEGEVQQWCDYEDGDQLQVRINGVVYLVHSTDCVLMNKYE